ncbi:hypothetical protein [Bradyrhizobium sp. CCBAU 51627]|uniref:hypothetical protein n=1 Tax=Bradyrhizobium sp. CCBAU 51627 TaxID=1325088 RepID=UPI002FE3A75F
MSIDRRFVMAGSAAQPDIIGEETRAGVFDVQRPTYPLLAAKLRARRDNLVSMIGVLDQRARLASEAP